MASGAELAMILRAKDEASGVFDKVKGSAGGLGSAFGSMMGGLATAGLAVGGVVAIGGAIAGMASSMVDGNAKMETYQTQLGTLLGSSDKAKERITQLAKIGAETPFDLPQLVAAEKIMAGFGLTTEKTQQLTGRSLDEYRRAIGDMAAATGAPLDEVTLLWSKFGSGATGEAISRLQELGIVTREQMAAMGVEFSKSGELVTPVPQAMKIAMDLANQKMGGGMKALSSTFEGQMSTLGDNIGQAKVLLMAPIFDVLKSSLTGLNEALASETFTSALTSMAETGAAAITGLIDSGKALLEIFQGGEHAGEAGDWLRTMLPMDVAEGIIETMISLGATWQNVLAGDIPGAVAAVTSVLDGFGQIITGAVESWASAFVDWFPGVSAGYGQFMADIATGLIDWILTSSFAIVEKLASWAAAFIDWIGPMIEPWMMEMGTYMSAMLGYLTGTALPMIVEKLATWGLAFIEWIGPRIQPMVDAAGRLLVALGDWIITTAAPAIVEKLAEWGKAFLGWMAKDVIPTLPDKLGEILTKVGDWIVTTAAPAIVTKLVEWGKAFLDFVAKDVIPELSGKLDEIVTKIGAWISGAVEGLKSAAGALGTALIDGIVQAVSNGYSRLSGAINGVIQQALGAAREDNESNSPSRKWARELGQPLLDGIVQPFLAGGRGTLAEAVTSTVRPVSVQPSLVASGAGRGGFGGGNVTNVYQIHVSGSLIHERELPGLVVAAFSQGLRR